MREDNRLYERRQQQLGRRRQIETYYYVKEVDVMGRPKFMRVPKGVAAEIIRLQPGKPEGKYIPAGNDKNVSGAVVRNPRIIAHVNAMHLDWFNRNEHLIVGGA